MHACGERWMCVRWQGAHILQGALRRVIEQVARLLVVKLGAAVGLHMAHVGGRQEPDGRRHAHPRRAHEAVHFAEAQRLRQGAACEDPGMMTAIMPPCSAHLRIAVIGERLHGGGKRTGSPTL